MLGNYSLYVDIYIFYVVVSSEFFFARVSIKCKWFLNKPIWPIEGTLIGITTLGQSGTGSNGYEQVLHTSQISRSGASLSDAV